MMVIVLRHFCVTPQFGGVSRDVSNVKYVPRINKGWEILTITVSTYFHRFLLPLFSPLTIVLSITLKQQAGGERCREEGGAR